MTPLHFHIQLLWSYNWCRFEWKFWMVPNKYEYYSSFLMIIKPDLGFIDSIWSSSCVIWLLRRKFNELLLLKFLYSFVTGIIMKCNVKNAQVTIGEHFCSKTNMISTSQVPISPLRFNYIFPISDLIILKQFRKVEY